MSHSMRRHDREVTDPAVIDEILSAGRYATVGLSDGDEPYVVTLSCGYDAQRNRLCFHVAPAGRKLDIIAKNPRASATIVDDLGYNTGACEHPFRSVVISGTMRMLEDPEDVRVAMRTLIAQLESESDAAVIYERNKLDTEAALVRFRLLVLDIDDVSAKQGE
jgi:uncharacterized protein